MADWEDTKMKNPYAGVKNPYENLENVYEDAQVNLKQAEFEKDYGTFDISIQDGTINYPENGKTDS